VSARYSFVAMGHRSREEAEAALDQLERLASEGAIEIRDACVAEKTEAGRIELYQHHQLSVGEAAVGGGVAGVVAGIVLGLPIALPAAGIAIGGLVGAFDRGIDDKRMRSLGAGLGPGQAALCALVGKTDWERVRAEMSPFVGELLVVELTPEAEEAVRASQGQHS
jgi:uncharacterized membrane protein